MPLHPCYHSNMTSPSERVRILVVDEDPAVLKLLTGDLIESLDYVAATARDAGLALKMVDDFGPDLIIASLTLPDISGKDLIVALRSKGIDAPVLVAAGEGMERDAIQAFRLGACDYIVKPLREAELVAAIERALQEVRLRREREQLSEQLVDINRQLARRVRELTTLYGIGKAVTSTAKQSTLFSKLMEGSLYVTEADMGWILLQEEDGDGLMLRAQRNLPPPFASKLHQRWDDGLSSLVMISGDALNVHGDGLGQFKLASLGDAALITPIKVRDKPIGVMGVVRQESRPFTDRDQAMLEAVADYASISLVNARLFQALAGRAQRFQRTVSAGLAQRQAGLDEDHIKKVREVVGRLLRLAMESHDPHARATLEALTTQLEDLLEDLVGAAGLRTSDQAAV